MAEQHDRHIRWFSGLRRALVWASLALTATHAAAQDLPVRILEGGLPDYSYADLLPSARGSVWITTPGAPEPALLRHDFTQGDNREVQRIPLSTVPLGVTATARVGDKAYAAGIFAADGSVHLVVLQTAEVKAIELPLPKLQTLSSLAWVGQQIVAGGQTTDGKPWVGQVSAQGQLLRERVLTADGQAVVSDVGALGPGLVAVINPTDRAGPGQLAVLGADLAPVRSVRAAGAAMSAAFPGDGLVVSYSVRQERFLERLDPSLKRMWQVPLPRRVGESLARAVVVATPAYVAAVSGNDRRLAVTTVAPNGSGAVTLVDAKAELNLPLSGYAVHAQPKELTVIGLARLRGGAVTERAHLFKAVVNR